MEHNWTYIFQELKLVCTQSKEYSFEESTQLIQAASSEIFLPKAKDLGGNIVKNRSAKNLIRFDQLKNAESYISQIGKLLEEFRKQKSNFYLETTTYVWTQSSESLSAENMLTLKKVSNLLKSHTGNYCSQKLELTSHRFGKIIVDTDDFYICELIPHLVKIEGKKTRVKSLRFLFFFLTLAGCILLSKQIYIKLKTRIDSNRYNKLLVSLASNKPELTFHLLKNMNIRKNDEALDKIIFRYIEQEWKIFFELPKGSSPQLLNERFQSLTEVFPWSKALKFITELLNLSTEFDQNKIPVERVKSILHNSSFDNTNKVIILINFCHLNDIDPFFLSSELKKSNLKNHNSLYLSFFENCLMHDIKGKEMVFLNWFEELPSLEMKKHLEKWTKNSVLPLDKNSYTLLIMMQQMDPFLAKNYIKRKLSENTLIPDEIEILYKIKDSSTREILAVYLEGLIDDLNRRNLDPELQNTAKSVLNRITG